MGCPGKVASLVDREAARTAGTATRAQEPVTKKNLHKSDIYVIRTAVSDQVRIPLWCRDLGWVM